jgi:FMN phosphatase YigB (HAD superfamily)
MGVFTLIDTFLFDLDGTLLPLDVDKFMEIYYHELLNEFLSRGDPGTIVDSVMEAAEIMLINDGSKYNSEVFYESFKKLVGGKADTYIEVINNFYKGGYLKIKDVIKEEPLIKKSIQILKAKSYNLVVATNPLFPKEAILKRITWAGLNVNDFIYVTTYENSSFCKPNIKYYDEILKAINKEPEQCIMVGNDVQEDIVVSKLGVKTYLIVNHVINRSEDKIKCDYIGTYKDFYDFASNF